MEQNIIQIQAKIKEIEEREEANRAASLLIRDELVAARRELAFLAHGLKVGVIVTKPNGDRYKISVVEVQHGCSARHAPYIKGNAKTAAGWSKRAVHIYGEYKISTT